ncbi:MGDG synthase family glycosyltransferase [Paenibacillus aestuarii]|uniref:Glycosyltransferase n=1 Tax=Paenibacillus aestuarii TaxID=516965 RepID=A0ABW0K714_9BACL|nr:glycosyltransferase [Paenibacillus aestuarii]
MNKPNPRIMILTAKFGEGHLQASQSLKQSFINQSVQDIRVIDLFQAAHPFFNEVSKKVYLTSMRTPKYGLDYYGWSYYITRYNKLDRPWTKYFNYIGEKKLREIIVQEQPDAIINVFPFGAAPEVAHKLDIPTFTVLTDYALHNRWVHPEMSKYYVATNELKDELVSQGFSQEQIEVTGIPIREAFYHVSPQTNKYGQLLDPAKKTVMIAAGAYGVLDEIKEMVQFLLSQVDCQIAIVCGRNSKLEASLNEDFAAMNHVHIFGFVENIQDLMALSSCIVTKAGGLTLSEALSLALPVFIYKPFGGQEKENALFFLRSGIGKIAGTNQVLEEQLVQFLSDDSIAIEMKKRMQAIRKWHAADHIVQNILQTIASEQPQPVLV